MVSHVAAGAITHHEAKERRRIEQEETTFFGSLDGTSKSVKGDVIAGLLVALLNLVVGLKIGIGVHDMSFATAIETYSILTVGDGLVSQIPSVITSIAAALLLSKGGVTGSADRALLDQLGGYPGALATVVGLMALFAFFPGLPFVPFMVGATGLGVAAALSVRIEALRVEAGLKPEPGAGEADAAPKRSFGDLLDVDEIHVRFAPDLIASVLDPTVGLEKPIVNMRRHIASGFGVVMPEVRLTDDPLIDAGRYAIRIQGIDVTEAVLRPGHVLVLTREDVPLDVPGEDVAEPVYGAPDRWVPTARQEDAAALALLLAPIIAPMVEHSPDTVAALGLAILAEAVAGLIIGLAFRLLIFAMQIAGAVAAQHLSISHMFGAGLAPEPEPTIATLLALAGIVLALNAGLHVHLVAGLAGLYRTLRLGELVGGEA